MYIPESRLFNDYTENVISDILATACKTNRRGLSTGEEVAKEEFYNYLQLTPYASMVAELSESLDILGLKLVSK